jgi:hypothetical protein
MLTAFPQRITKLNAAERKLTAAIRGFFNNEDAVVVYSLASDAFEVLDALCRKQKLKSFSDEAAEAMTAAWKEHGKEPRNWRKALADSVNRHRNFFKHARGNDADAVVDDFTDENNDALLFMASYDLLQLCRVARRGGPVEAQIYQLWYWALQGTADVWEPTPPIAMAFPDLARRPRYEQKVLGREAIEWARNEPVLAERVPIDHHQDSS